MRLHISKKRVFGKTEYQIIERPEIKGYSYNTYLLFMKHIEIFLSDERVISIYEENSTLKMLGIILLNMLQFNSYTMYIGEKQCGKIKPAFLFVLNPCFSFITPEATYTLRLHSNNICSVTCNSKQIMTIRGKSLTEFEKNTYTVECEDDTALMLALLFCSFMDTTWYKNDLERSVHRFSKSIVPFDRYKHQAEWHTGQ